MIPLLKCTAKKLTNSDPAKIGPSLATQLSYTKYAGFHNIGNQIFLIYFIVNTIHPKPFEENIIKKQTTAWNCNAQMNLLNKCFDLRKW